MSSPNYFSQNLYTMQLPLEFALAENWNSSTLERFGYSEKISFIVNVLRSIENDPDLKDHQLIIPDECEYLGFLPGYYDTGGYLHFIADMLEE